MKLLLLALLSGLLFALSLPPLNWEWLAYACLTGNAAGLVVILRRKQSA